jgi:hypothetical protein
LGEEGGWTEGVRTYSEWAMYLHPYVGKSREVGRGWGASGRAHVYVYAHAGTVRAC